ncbi:MAG TPA: hypothetical protein DCR58_02090 [Idiomarina baltica]|uniref:Uncharacterized protein n=1 Tax=Idiomarina baltica TaxID=190892 RepID=A0A348WLZ5_9GAMM|nr:hypothetical protein [Idiomarina baltica]
MLKNVLFMSIAVAGCLGFGALAAVSINELFLCGDNFTYKSLAWFLAVLSLLLVCVFLGMLLCICNQILTNKPCKITKSD